MSQQSNPMQVINGVKMSLKIEKETRQKDNRDLKETVYRLVGLLIQRHLMPFEDANYILECLGGKADAALPGKVFFDDKGERNQS